MLCGRTACDTLLAHSLACSRLSAAPSLMRQADAGNGPDMPPYPSAAQDSVGGEGGQDRAEEGTTQEEGNPAPEEASELPPRLPKRVALPEDAAAAEGLKVGQTPEVLSFSPAGKPFLSPASLDAFMDAFLQPPAHGMLRSRVCRPAATLDCCIEEVIVRCSPRRPLLCGTRRVSCWSGWRRSTRCSAGIPRTSALASPVSPGVCGFAFWELHAGASGAPTLLHGRGSARV